MTSPYIPPNIEIFYEAPDGTGLVPDHFEPVPEVPIDRQYSHMENSYAEPPMTHVESHSHFYAAKEFHQTWNEFTQEAKPEEENKSIPDVPEESEMRVKVEEVCLEEKRFDLHVDEHNNKSSPRPSSKPEEEDQKKSSIGSGTSTSPSYQSGGGGASWGPGDYPQHQVDDGHRQYNWEKGQIDYMGVDSFDNIMRQLDTRIQPVNKDTIPHGGVGAPKSAATNGVKDGPPAAKSRVLQALENQFREGSEFRKSSTDLVLPVPPRKPVHRATVLLPPKVYREQVINKAAASAPRSSGLAAGAQVTSAAGSKLTATQLPAAAAQKPAAAAAAAQQPIAGFSQPAAIHQPAAPLSAAQLPAMASSAPVAQPLGLTSPTGAQTSPVYEKTGSTVSPQAVLPQEQFSPTRGVVGGFHGGQGQIGSAHTPAFDDSGFGAYSSDTGFSSGPSPLAFSTPAAAGHPASAAGHPASAGFAGQLPAKTSPASPPSAPFDPFSAQTSFTSGSQSKTAFSAGDPFTTRGGVDPFAAQGAKQVGPGATVSGGIGGASRQTPAAAAGVEFEEPSAGQHHQQQQKSKRAGNKRGKK